MKSSFIHLFLHTSIFILVSAFFTLKPTNVHIKGMVQSSLVYWKYVRWSLQFQADVLFSSYSQVVKPEKDEF